MNIAKHKTYRILIRIAVACLLLMVRHDAYAGTREAEPMMLEADSVVVGEKAEAADSVRGAVHESVPVMADGRLMRLNMRKAKQHIHTAVQPDGKMSGLAPDVDKHGGAERRFCGYAVGAGMPAGGRHELEPRGAAGCAAVQTMVEPCGEERAGVGP